MLEAELVALHSGDQLFVGAHAVVALVVPGGHERQSTVRVPEQRNELCVVVQEIGSQYEVAEDQNELFGRRGLKRLLVEKLPLDPGANLVEPSTGQIDPLWLEAKQLSQSLQFVRGFLEIEDQHVAGQSAALPEDGLQRQTEQVVFVGQYRVGENEDGRSLKWNARCARRRTDVEGFVHHVVFWKLDSS